jgi:hypothetical protein
VSIDNPVFLQLMQKQNDELRQLLELERELRNDCIERIGTLTGYVSGLVDDVPCRFKNHDYCQTHMREKPCLVDVARTDVAEHRLASSEPEVLTTCRACGGKYVSCAECHQMGKLTLRPLDSCWRECPAGHLWRCRTGIVRSRRAVTL